MRTPDRRVAFERPAPDKTTWTPTKHKIIVGVEKATGAAEKGRPGIVGAAAVRFVTGRRMPREAAGAHLVCNLVPAPYNPPNTFKCATTLRPSADSAYPPSSTETILPFAYLSAISPICRVTQA